jgi:hypothetical protein
VPTFLVCSLFLRLVRPGLFKKKAHNAPNSTYEKRPFMRIVTKVSSMPFVLNCF